MSLTFLNVLPFCSFTAMKYSPISAELFRANRERFCAKLPPGSMAILVSNDDMPSSGDATFPFKQNPDLFYLTGIDQEKTMLILYPDAPDPKHREILFLRQTSDLIKVWEGHKYTKEEGKAMSGIDNVLWNNDFEPLLNMLAHRAERLFLGGNENDRAANPVGDGAHRFAHQLRDRFPLHEFRRAAPLLMELRMVKSEIEVSLIQEACNITGKGFRRVLEFVRPGVTEYEIEAEITHEFLMNRATGHAYHPIIASGADSNILHYGLNNKPCEEGQMLLMDFGAEYANYNADLTRTIPVSGSFTDRQRAVYDAVLRVKNEATAMLRPGTSIPEYNKEVGKIMENELIGLKLLDKTAVSKQDPDAPLYKKYFMHGTSHHLGLDVHDIGNRFGVMAEGNVFTVEPGIYIPDEGFGVRLENDVLITNGKPVDLMADIPVDAEEIESLMNASVRG